MHDLVTNIQVIAAALGTIATAWAVFHKSNRENYSNIFQELKSEISELRAERDEFRKYYHIERDRRTALEKQLEAANDQIRELKEKLVKLKRH